MWNIHLRDAVMMRCGDLHKRELLNFRLIREKFQRTHVILLGAGWYQYQDEPTGYTKRILKRCWMGSTCTRCATNTRASAC